MPSIIEIRSLIERHLCEYAVVDVLGVPGVRRERVPTDYPPCIYFTAPGNDGRKCDPGQGIPLFEAATIPVIRTTRRSFWRNGAPYRIAYAPESMSDAEVFAALGL